MREHQPDTRAAVSADEAGAAAAAGTAPDAAAEEEPEQVSEGDGGAAQVTASGTAQRDVCLGEQVDGALLLGQHPERNGAECREACAGSKRQSKVAPEDGAGHQEVLMWGSA